LEDDDLYLIEGKRALGLINKNIRIDFKTPKKVPTMHTSIINLFSMM
jgi:hypothetical protein